MICNEIPDVGWLVGWSPLETQFSFSTIFNIVLLWFLAFGKVAVWFISNQPSFCTTSASSSSTSSSSSSGSFLAATFKANSKPIQFQKSLILLYTKSHSDIIHLSGNSRYFGFVFRRFRGLRVGSRFPHGIIIDSIRSQFFFFFFYIYIFLFSSFWPSCIAPRVFTHTLILNIYKFSSDFCVFG